MRTSRLGRVCGGGAMRWPLYPWIQRPEKNLSDGGERLPDGLLRGSRVLPILEDDHAERGEGQVQQIVAPMPGNRGRADPSHVALAAASVQGRVAVEDLL